RTGAWLVEEARILGFEAHLEPVPLRRRTPVAASVQVGDRRFEGVPAFDGGESGADGVTARLGDGDGEIPVLRVPPWDGLPGARALDATRRSGRHPAILAVTDDRHVLPGLALGNAETFHAPFGPPVLQLPSDALDALTTAPGHTARVDVRFRAERVEAANVGVAVPGRDPGAAPVVLITPRSSWWHSTAERGGGIALWLDALRFLAARPPRRPVRLTANTGHELGHLGMQHFLDREEALVAGAHCWIHLGANFAAALAPRLRLQASDPALATQAEQALAAEGVAVDDRTPVGEEPYGEARDLHAGGGRYLSLLGSQGAFHHPADRWPDAVDLPRTVAIARAHRRLLAALVEAP
ncbi:MAG: hypothetical protein V2J02_09640, partial [Pseudomonadales bacterium]|nr:hypothetical protein [Pseudomonadales bacterium]